MKIRTTLAKAVATFAVLGAFAMPAAAETVRYISKAVPTDYGITCSFWRIDTLKIRVVSGQMTVYLEGWVNEDAFTAGHNPVTGRSVLIENISEQTVDTGDGGDQNLYELMAGKVYAMILATDLFQGGTVETVTVD